VAAGRTGGRRVEGGRQEDPVARTIAGRRQRLEVMAYSGSEETPPARKRHGGGICREGNAAVSDPVRAFQDPQCYAIQDKTRV